MAHGGQPAIARGLAVDTAALSDESRALASDTDEPEAIEQPLETARPGPQRGRIALAALLGLLAVGWIGVVIWSASGAPPMIGDLVVTVAITAAPLALLALLWVLFAPRPDAADRLRREATALDAALGKVVASIAAERAALTGQAELLGSVGRDSARQIGATALVLGEETALIGLRANELAEAAALARVDLGVVMADLPRAEAQVRLVGDQLREAARVAGDGAADLDHQLQRIAAGGREAEAGVGGAAQRMSTELGRIEAAGAEAGRGIELVAAAMARAANDALERAARAIEAMREAIEAEGEALSGTIERARVSLELAGADRLAEVDANLAALQARLAAFGQRLAEESESGQALVGLLGQSLDEVGLRIQAVGDAGTERTADLAETIATLGEHADGLTRRIGDAAGETNVALERRMSALADLRVRLEREAGAFEQVVAADGASRLARQVSLMIEALNSISIDVSRLLSGEIPDTAWAAYLRGDRGVFTRGAVRLLGAGEAREMLGRYEADADFRELVNRYVHDFEAMLRRVLAEGDDTPLAITLLSSDMGKLYVALAQAIDRLRA